MSPRTGKLRLALSITVLLTAIVAAALFALRVRYRNRPIALTGAVIQQNDDTRKQAPIADVDVVAAGGQAQGPAKTNAYGYFRLLLQPDIRRGQPITVEFRNAHYKPFTLNTTASDDLYVIHMVPLQSGADDEETVPSGKPLITITNIVIRYSTETTVEANIGTGVTTFQVPNQGGIPCDPHQGPCSPDGKWKAAIGSASLDAGAGNVYRNARVFCIAGPCPFTKIVNDDFTKGGQNIAVSELNWSDTTTFLFQAEVFRRQVSDIIRESYPVIYGRAFNFSLPSTAEGPSLEAELDRTPIVFPLGPDPKLSWASCNVIMGNRSSKNYRCELKPGYKFP
jgi:hypothetical protein